MAVKKNPPTQKGGELRPALAVHHHSGLFVSALTLALFLAGCVVEPPSKRPGASARLAGKRGAPSAQVENLPPFEYAVVGTIHKFHLIQKDYPLQTLKALVEAYSPDLVLVEIRPSAFKQGHYEDGPFEMAYVTHIAKNKHIPVVPIDWWLAQEAGTAGGDAPKSKEARCSVVGRRFRKTFALSLKQNGTCLEHAC